MIKPLHLLLGSLGVGVVAYLVIKPSVSASPALPTKPVVKVPVTVADLGKFLQADLTNFTMSAWTNAPGNIDMFPPNPREFGAVGPFRLMGGSVSPNGTLSRLDGRFTFPAEAKLNAGAVAYGSIPPEAVLSVGPPVVPVTPPVIPSVPLTPAGLFPDLAVGDLLLVDAQRANLPSSLGLLGQVVMRVDMVLTDRSLVSAATYPIKTFSGTIPRDAIVQRMPAGPTPSLSV